MFLCTSYLQDVLVTQWQCAALACSSVQPFCKTVTVGPECTAIQGAAQDSSPCVVVVCRS